MMVPLLKIFLLCSMIAIDLLLLAHTYDS